MLLVVVILERRLGLYLVVELVILLEVCSGLGQGFRLSIDLHSIDIH